MRRYVFLFLIICNSGLAQNSSKKNYSCETNKRNLIISSLNTNNYYKYLYALSMARTGVDSELIRRSVDIQESELLDPGNPQHKAMYRQLILVYENILINSGCTSKEAKLFKYEFSKEMKRQFFEKKKAKGVKK